MASTQPSCCTLLQLVYTLALLIWMQGSAAGAPVLATYNQVHDLSWGTAEQSAKGQQHLFGHGSRRLLSNGQGSDNPDAVSVVIMNWMRPDNLRRILNKYTKYTNVLEIIILMCKKDTMFEYSHPKVVLVDSIEDNEVYGLSTRFQGCQKARSPWVLIQDDDLFTSQAGIEAMMQAKRQYPGRLVGCCGRDWRGPEPEYIPFHTEPGPARLVMTIMMMTDRDMCPQFFKYSPLVEDIVRKGKPFWNGEDIFFSLVTYKVTQQLPLVVDFPYQKMTQNGTGIHLGKRHQRFRGRFLKIAIKRLGIQYKDPEASTSMFQLGSSVVDVISNLFGRKRTTSDGRTRHKAMKHQ